MWVNLFLPVSASGQARTPPLPGPLRHYLLPELETLLSRQWWYDWAPDTSVELRWADACAMVRPVQVGLSLSPQPTPAHPAMAWLSLQWLPPPTPMDARSALAVAHFASAPWPDFPLAALGGIPLLDHLMGRVSALVPGLALSPMAGQPDHRFMAQVLVGGLAAEADWPPPADTLRGWADLDPPEGYDAGEVYSQQWLRGRTVERWTTRGQWHGFSGHTWVWLFAHAPPEWAVNIWQGSHPPVYLRLGLLMAKVRALRLAHAAVAAHYSEKDTARIRKALEGVDTPTVSAEDQGRQLMGAWRMALDLDGIVQPRRGND